MVGRLVVEGSGDVIYEGLDITFGVVRVFWC